MLCLLEKLHFDNTRTTENIAKLTELFPHNDYYGCNTGVDHTDDSGKMTYSLTILRSDGNRLNCTADMRIPLSFEADGICSSVSEAIRKKGFDVAVVRKCDPHYVDPDSYFVRTLLKIYKEFNGRETKTSTMYGCTYANQTQIGVAFGQLSGSNPHGVNESIPISNIIGTANLLARTILEFCL